MKKEFIAITNLLILILILMSGMNKTFAQTPISNNDLVPTPSKIKQETAVLTATPPEIDAAAYILLDVNTGRVLVEKNADVKRAPASLTKMMTLYVITDALKQGRIKLDDQVLISEQAWRTGGSKMFVKVGDSVKVSDLIQGIVVVSGNDACVAMSEHLAGSESSFASVMNQQAKLLGMNNSHFEDSNGLPNENHYSTARDLATLGTHIILDFPDEYKWYSQQYFTYNNIKQHNRNRLLWSNLGVDGLKTGFTDEAGYCLVSSALKDKTRLLAVILGAPSEKIRTAESQRLLTWGFRFFSTEKLYQKNQIIVGKQRVWKGEQPYINIGVNQDIFATLATGQSKNLKANIELPKLFEAPIRKGQKLGTLTVTLDGQPLISQPLVALESSEKGGFFTRCRDSIGLMFHGWFGSDDEPVIQQTNNS